MQCIVGIQKIMIKTCQPHGHGREGVEDRAKERNGRWRGSGSHIRVVLLHRAMK